MNFKPMIKQVGFAIQKNSPYILTGLGAAGVVSTAILSGKAAVKASRTIEDHEDLMLMKLSQEELAQRGDPNCYISNWKEKVQLTWKHFIPPVVMGTLSVTAIIGAQSVNTRRHAAIASLYTLSESTLKDYREKVKENLSVKKEEKIYDDVMQDRLDKNPVSNNEVILTGNGETLCYDVHSGRYFKSDIETLRRIQNDFNHELMGTMWVPLNDLYCMMGLGTVKIGDEIGWTVDELLDFRFSTRLADDGKTPCLVVDYDLTPRSLKGPFWGGM